MESFGIVDPQKRENFILRLYVDKKFAHIKMNSEKVNCNFQRDRCLGQNEREKFRMGCYVENPLHSKE
jgi:hypothetical protein